MSQHSSHLTLISSPDHCPSEMHRGLGNGGDADGPAAGRGVHAAPRTGNSAAILGRLLRYEKLAALEHRARRSVLSAREFTPGGASRYLHRMDRWARILELLTRERFSLGLELRMGEVSRG